MKNYLMFLLFSFLLTTEIIADENDYYKKINNPDTLAVFAAKFANNQEFENAINGYYKAASLYKKKGKIERQFVNLIHMARCFCDMGYYKESSQYYDQAEKLLPLVTESKSKRKYYHYRAMFYKMNMKFAKAIDYRMKEIEYITDFKAEKQNYISVGNCYVDLLNIPKCMEYYNKALDISRKHNLDPSGIYLNIAVAYLNSGRPDSSYYYLNLSKSVGEESVELFLNLAIATSQLGMIDSALYYIKIGEEIAKKNNTLELLAYNNYICSTLHQKLKNYDSSFHYLKLAEDFYLTTKNYSIITDIYMKKAEFFDDIGLIDSSAKYLKLSQKYKNMQDSSENAYISSRKTEVAGINTRLKEIDVEIDSVEAGFGNTYLIIITAVVLAAVVIVLYYINRKRKGNSR